jgi:hypothetical protein
MWIKKTLILLVLLGVLLCQPLKSEANVLAYVAGASLSSYVGLSIALHAVVIGILTYWGMTPAGPGTHSVSNGVVSRDATVVWVSLDNMIPHTNTATNPATVTTSQLSNAARANPSRYPNLNNISQHDANGLGGVDDFTHVNSYVNSPSGPRRVTSVTLYGPTSIGTPAGTIVYSGSPAGETIYSYYTSVGDLGYVPGQSTYMKTVHTVSDVPVPNIVTSTPTEVQNALITSPTNNSIRDTFRNEIDDYITSTPNIVPSTPLPVSADPTAVANAAVTAAAAATVTATTTNTTTTTNNHTSSTVTATAAATALTAAQTAATAAAATLAANPTSPAAIAANATAQSNLASAQTNVTAASNGNNAAAAAASAASLADAENAQKVAEAAAVSTAAETASNSLTPNVYAPAVDSDKPVGKDIPSLLASFVAGSPIVSMVRSFTVSTTNASGVIPIGTIYGKDLVFDFTRWQSVLAGCGGVLIIIMHGVAVLVVIRGW